MSRNMHENQNEVGEKIEKENKTKTNATGYKKKYCKNAFCVQVCVCVFCVCFFCICFVSCSNRMATATIIDYRKLSCGFSFIAARHTSHQ